MSQALAAPIELTFLRDHDFAAIVTPARGVPTGTSHPDEIVIWHLANRTLLVDTEAGVICRADGVTRAETPQPSGIGRVYLGRVWGKVRYAQAHRIVWIARHGQIPGNYRITQINGRPWDNRIANLTIATHSETMTAKSGRTYLGPDVNGSEDDRPAIPPYVSPMGVRRPPRSKRRSFP